MFYLLITLIILAAVLLTFIVLIQNPKGGGLASGFTGSNIMGVQRTGDFLEKGTWLFLGVIMVCSILLTVTNPHQQATTGRGLRDQITAPSENAVPSAPAKGQLQPTPTIPSPQQQVPADSLK